MVLCANLTHVRYNLVDVCCLSVTLFSDLQCCEQAAGWMIPADPLLKHGHVIKGLVPLAPVGPFTQHYWFTDGLYSQTLRHDDARLYGRWLVTDKNRLVVSKSKLQREIGKLQFYKQQECSYFGYFCITLLSRFLILFFKYQPTVYSYTEMSLLQHIYYHGPRCSTMLKLTPRPRVTLLLYL